MANNERFLEIDVDAEDMIRALEKAPIEIMRHWAQAGREVGEEVVKSRGLRTYPAAPPNNAPPYPGYLRGIGYVYADGTNDGKSERYGTQFTVRQRGRTQTIIGNRASYAEHLAGENQSRKVSKNIPGRGWRILGDVVDEKIKVINRIYTAWMRKALRKIGLL